jgi:large subunit ribosomal protein L5
MDHMMPNIDGIETLHRLKAVDGPNVDTPVIVLTANAVAGAKEMYKNEVAPQLMKKFNYKSVMEIPKLDKIVINVTSGEIKDNSKILDSIISDLKQITGQTPVVCKAKKSVANFKLREGMDIGAKVTLRGDRMYEFLDRFFNLALPRVRDFRGINPNSFDGRGNYSVGIKEQLIFPEIEYDKIDKVRGMDISFITTAKSDEEGRELLTLLGAPFAK